jgi:hypothetical protein
MNEKQIFSQIDALVTEEHGLRARRASGAIDPEVELARLRHVEESLDQCWDLLRRRAALRESGGNPDGATSSSVNRVEGYLQ